MSDLVIYRWIVEARAGGGRRALHATRGTARRERDRLNEQPNAAGRYVVRRLPVAIMASADESRWIEHDPPA